jgi:diketogulonate reductase-like aldo/keto reductase
MHWPIAWEFTNFDLDPPQTRDTNDDIKFAKVSIQQTWQAMEKLVEQGLVKSIGVSNFTHGEILDVLTYAKIPPAVNQVSSLYLLILFHRLNFILI